MSEAEAIMDILRRYEKLSGQMVNLDKCEVSFSKSLIHDVRRRVSSVLGIKEVLSHDKCLGLPTLFQRSKKISFTGIKDRIWKKLQGWKEKLLSKAGKEVLIKAVAQAIPTYAMSCFRLPTSFCDDVERIIRNFWWGTSNSVKDIPWKTWKDLCRPKSEGGLGFRDLKIFNNSLLAKQLWRLHCYPESLLARSLRARYFPSSSLWETGVGFNPSYAWRSSWGSRQDLERGVRWRVGDGKTIKLWHDAWIGGEGTRKLICPIRVLDSEVTVDALIDTVHNSWREEVISEVLLPVDKDRILQIPLSTSGAIDERVWTGSNDGVFRVRDMYAMTLREQFEVSSSNGCDLIWQQVWGLNVHPKAKLFLWRSIWNILPHGSNLHKKGINNVERCVRCGLLKSNEHALRDCQWVREVWLNIMCPNDISQTYPFASGLVG